MAKLIQTPMQNRIMLHQMPEEVQKAISEASRRSMEVARQLIQNQPNQQHNRTVTP